MSTLPKTRTRKIVYKNDPYWHFSYRPGQPPLYDERGRFSIVGTQKTVSEGHPWTNEGYKGEDIGGPFWTMKQEFGDNRGLTVNMSPMYSFKGTSGTGRVYQELGPLYAVPPNATTGPYRWPDASFSDEVNLAAYGTKAIALCKPTNSVADLSTALGELFREGLPSMIGAAAWQTRLRDIRASGDEYLNIQFGWLPLVSDIRKAAIPVREARKILAQYERDAGRLVRRRFEFPLQVEVGPVEQLGTAVEPYMPNRSLTSLFYTTWPLTSSQGVLTRVRTTTTKRWFSGAFTYYLPSGYDSRSVVDRAALAADRIYGLSVTPETLWNLAPWSWAVDWFTNIGDVISNVSDFINDGLLLRYGYIMETIKVSDTYTLANVPLKDRGPVNLTMVKSTTVKQRLPATPFGFGLTFDGLSTKQKAILTALGITRVR
jgi:hypothetical protein